MAQKRMFDKSIIDTERFYSLPMESQLLYFHLGLHADVKGFVEPRKIARLTGIKIEAIQPLATLNFVIPFESGVVVIREWNLHNSIREDREAPTRFVEELSRLSISDGAIYEVQEYSSSSPAQYSIEEYSIEKNPIITKSNVATLQKVMEKEIIKNNKYISSPDGEEGSVLSDVKERDFETFWSNYPRKAAKQPAKKLFFKLTEQERSTAIKSLAIYPFSLDSKYVPHASTYINQKRWEDEIKPTTAPNLTTSLNDVI